MVIFFTLGSALLCEESAQNMLLVSSINNLLFVLTEDKHKQDIFTPKVWGDKNEASVDMDMHDYDKGRHKLL